MANEKEEDTHNMCGRFDCITVHMAFVARTLNDILDIDEDLFGTITVQVSEFGVSNGSPYIDIYRLDIPSAEDDNYAPVMSLIRTQNFGQILGIYCHGMW